MMIMMIMITTSVFGVKAPGKRFARNEFRCLSK
jgi:hypothetical protein